MLKIRVCALRNDRKRVIERMQRLGVVEIEPAKKLSEGVWQEDMSGERDGFQSTLSALQSAVSVLDYYAPAKDSMFSSYMGRKEINGREFEEMQQKGERTLSSCYEITRKKKQIEQLAADKLRLQLRVDSLAPWLGLDVKMRIKGTKSTKAFVGVLPNIYTEEQLILKAAEKHPDLTEFEIEVIGETSDSTCIFAVAANTQADSMDSFLRSLGITRPFEMSKKTPRECSKELRVRIEKCDREIADLEDEIREMAELRGIFKWQIDYYTMRLEKYEAIEKIAHTKNTFIIDGWIPEGEFPRLQTQLEERGAFVETLTIGKKENVPVAVKNGPITEGGEPILEMYAMPTKRDIDPTPVMAIFYYLLFGLMLSDAAYGLMLVLACGFVLLKFKPEGSNKKNMKLFMFSGATAVVWGVLFGSFFGDLPNVIAHTFFGVPQDVLILKPLWFDPIIEPTQMLIFSLALGVIHIFAGMILGLITNLKNKNYTAMFADNIAWMMVVGGLIVYGVDFILDMFGMGGLVVIPPDIKNVAIIAAGVGAVTVLLFSGLPTKSFGKRILKGAYSLYGITSYLSDILSYSRVLALGLATGVISQVFNMIGTMFGGGAAGAIMLLIVGLLGHALNIGISLIGCYVHTCRLQYVEFFGRFYEGGGRPFSPFSVKSKSFKFKEEK
jgi:V/A-type H+-transporting ATPase subunit I